MGWFNTLKLHPKLNEIMDEQASGKTYFIKDFGSDVNSIETLWNASNPNEPFSRTGSRFAEYPIDRWFGLVTKEGDNDRLVAVSGFAEREGKEGDDFAYVGGTKVSTEYQGEGGLKVGGEKAARHILGARTGAMTVDNLHNQIAGYTDKGWATIGSKKNIKLPEGEKHDVIPDKVIQHFKDVYKEKWSLMKWMKILKVDIDFDSDKDVEEGMMGYYATPKKDWEKRQKEVLNNFKQFAKEQLGLNPDADGVTDEDLMELIDLRPPKKHIKIFHQNAYKGLKQDLKREPTDKEIINRMTNLISHEATHAAHDIADPEFMERPEEQKEYVAYMLQYPDSVIDALTDLFHHPATGDFKPKDDIAEFMIEQGMPEGLALMLDMAHYEIKRHMKPLFDMVKWAAEITGGNKKDAEVLVRVELINKKANPSGWDFPTDYEDAKRRYSELYKNNPKRRKNFEAWLKGVFE